VTERVSCGAVNHSGVVCTSAFYVVTYMMMQLLMLQDDVVTENDAVTSDSHQRLSSAADSHQNESVSDSGCQKGILNKKRSCR